MRTALKKQLTSGAPNQTRTGMGFTPRDFKSLVSANSTTGAYLIIKFIINGKSLK